MTAIRTADLVIAKMEEDHQEWLAQRARQRLVDNRVRARDLLDALDAADKPAAAPTAAQFEALLQLATDAVALVAEVYGRELEVQYGDH